MQYRADIDGLRAVAVLAVIFFHFTGADWFQGYMGVDVFFVISGFLITQILVKDLEAEDFSLVRFYERRARRILPALFVVLLVSAMAAYLLFLPREMMSFGKSLIGAALSGSNFVFWLESGYFDLEAQTKPLLHTWSLGIEEQFYILYPLILWGAFKYSRRWLPHTLIAIWIVTFAINMIYVMNGDADSAFYLILARAWELMTGALLALNIVPPLSKKLSMEKLVWAGLIVMLTGFFWNVGSDEFPGIFALFPALGTAMVIHAGRFTQDTGFQRFLSHPAMNITGRISYSFYLWHWPLFVFATYYMLGDVGVGARIALFILSYGLAYLSWRYIEQPVRNRHGAFSRRAVFIFGGAGIILCCLIASVLLAKDGRGPRYRDYMAEILDVHQGALEKIPIDIGLYDEANTVLIGKSAGLAQADIALWGDSHANALGAGLAKEAAKRGRTILQIAGNLCLLLEEYRGVIEKTEECVDYTQQAFDFLVSQPQIKTVILANHWHGHMRKWIMRDGLEQSLRVRADSILALIHALEEAGKTVVVVAQVPEIQSESQNIASLVARIDLYGRDIDLRVTPESFNEQQKYIRPMYALIEEETSATIIWPHKALCDAHYCKIREGNRLYYYDEDHISRFGAESISYIFEGLF